MKVDLEQWQIVALRNYFRLNDKTSLEHWAFNVFDKALKQQLIITDVVGRSEQLKAFREWWNKDNEGVCTTITHKDIDRYLESL